MFATDRDLLVIEPNLFRDVGFLCQRLLKTTGSISAGVLTIAGDAAAAGVDAGHIVLHADTPLEVIERLTSTTLSVSLLRAGPSDAAIPPSNASSSTVTVGTFAPQLALVHAGLLAALGLRPADGDAADTDVTEDQVVNPRDLARAEALAALHLIYEAAAPMAGPESATWARAAMYRARAARERQRAAARIDLDGDGNPDATRRLGVVVLRR